MNWVELSGHIGSFLSSVTFIPQVYKTWKTRSAGDLSITMMLIVFTSTIVWLVYGIALELWPVITANGIICVLSLLLIIFKLSFKK
ncbi:MAG: SemiSWEET family transporter [Chitinophagaceae bacterium]|jgi:MtN3 and saliva related transmembrane protein|nr:SemiSWEET family transporter [Chitinophagaceae bacterium]